MLEDVAAFLIVAPLASGLLLAAIVAAWLAPRGGQRAQAAPTTLMATDAEVAGPQRS